MIKLVISFLAVALALTGDIPCESDTNGASAVGGFSVDHAAAFGKDRLQIEQSGASLQAVFHLAQRVAPWLAPNLEFRLLPERGHKGIFELETANGKLIISASDPSSAAMGLNWYLKYYCHRSISHLGNNIGPVATLPKISGKLRKVSRFHYRYLLNYCTLNYSLAFADWPRWEREIDWMALNGVNLALAANGTEAVWQNTLRRIGYGDDEVFRFLPGPAYTAWWLMGNLEGWGGPVTQAMIDDRVALQRKILARMRELDIEPVLQGFYGMVPASIAEKFPAATVINQGAWGGFRRPAILLSSDPLFLRLASIYYEEQQKLYGPARFFGGDLFHEGGQAAGLDVAAVARGVHSAMLHENPEAVWVLQGWQENPKKELLAGLARDHILILNLEGDDSQKLKDFNDAPWVWGIVNNFGENTGMFGDLRGIASQPDRASQGPYGKSLVGIGALMEGINNNPVVYDLVFEMPWRSEPVDVHHWIAEYAKYRYGQTTPAINHAWELLLDTAYRSGSRPESIFCARPSLEVKGVSTWGTTRIDYDPARLEDAARELLTGADKLAAIDAYQADLVDVVRQVLANRGLVLYQQMVKQYEAGDRPAFQKTSDAFLQLLREQEKLVGTRKDFLLGNWLAAADAMGHTASERSLCQRNARMQITYWGPEDPAAAAHDYAFKEWSGLLRDYYLPRWEMFVRELENRLAGKPASNIHYFDFEKQWTLRSNDYPIVPSGDPVATASRAFSRATGAIQP
ncbi:MAG TPA: alpha-N-acetylglucosaminidase [Dongiaceae bacterium]|nr:alpha-N-acetylglucosaminidase [Dongiaceae bacterium]